MNTDQTDAGTNADTTPAPEQRTDSSGDAARAAFEALSAEAGGGGGAGADLNLDVILDVSVSLSLEVGRTRIPIRNLLQLNQGSVVELERGAGEPLDVFVNGTLIAQGEVVVVNDRFGVRLTDVVSPAERIKRLR
ncbi:flagellar motor switch protein FliN [Lysobacter sp. D1-1-M9]|uniref:flagellar motor switch protein FliN n=1 Tax=Novilysobacter longmucuonensis TaxID=3098603 RepID=UPI002FCB175F